MRALKAALVMTVLELVVVLIEGVDDMEAKKNTGSSITVALDEVSPGVIPATLPRPVAMVFETPEQAREASKQLKEYAAPHDHRIAIYALADPGSDAALKMPVSTDATPSPAPIIEPPSLADSLRDKTRAGVSALLGALKMQRLPETRPEGFTPTKPIHRPLLASIPAFNSPSVNVAPDFSVEEWAARMADYRGDMANAIKRVEEKSGRAFMLRARGYDDLAGVLSDAFKQASEGKGKERHANERPFAEQPMQTISGLLNSPAGMAFQVAKKIEEAQRLPYEQARRELLGAIVYAAGMVVYLDNQEKGDE